MILSLLFSHFCHQNFVPMEDRGHELFAVSIPFLVLSWVTMGLRVYVRVGMLKSFGIDDWAMAVTLVSLIYIPILLYTCALFVPYCILRKIHLSLGH